MESPYDVIARDANTEHRLHVHSERMQLALAEVATLTKGQHMKKYRIFETPRGFYFEVGYTTKQGGWAWEVPCDEAYGHRWEAMEAADAYMASI